MLEPQVKADAFLDARYYLNRQHRTLAEGVEGWLVNMEELLACWPPWHDFSGLLTKRERQRWCDYQTIVDDGLRARSFLFGRSVLRLLLADRLEVSPDQVPLTRDAHGKPQLENSCLHFNLSHSGEWLWLVISSLGPVGADVECLLTCEPVTEPLIEMVASPEEQRTLRQAPASKRDIVFLRLWVLKETYLKAIGSGLLQDPRLLKINDDNTISHIYKFNNPLCSQIAFIQTDSCIVAWAQL
ncbi:MULTISPECIES: 4'-phosphopantetheinyl transferase family protein [unclassified Endozoicomonas]|uniref:4'-phosphopantetheinyl transferase family protein n=1 Tax=unclassified Endozoicomonas TaxID=2644528 RepID=UPI003BB5BAEC